MDDSLWTRKMDSLFIRIYLLGRYKSLYYLSLDIMRPSINSMNKNKELLQSISYKKEFKWNWIQSKD